jgi:hypothetical protein
MNSTNPELFPRALMHLAHHHLLEGELEVARDYAIQGRVVCSQISSCDPDLAHALEAILRSTTQE